MTGMLPGMSSKTEWRKSSYCGSSACVEVARADGQVLVRDSKNPDIPPVRFSPDEWDAFLARGQSGQLNLSQLPDSDAEIRG